MPRRYAMSSLVTKCRQRVDMKTNQARSNADFKALISEQYGDLFSIVADAGLRYFEYTATLTTTGVAYVDEPDDHLATLSLDYLIDGTTTGKRREVPMLMAREQARWAGMTGGTEALRYALVDDRIYLYPTPPAGQLYEIRYIPQPPDMSSYADGDSVDVVTPDGEAFLVWGVAVKVHGELEGNAELAMVERDKARERLSNWAVNRAFSDAQAQVSDLDSYDPSSGDYEPWRYGR